MGLLPRWLRRGWAAQGGSEGDAELVYLVNDACAAQGCGDLLGEVFALPRRARRELRELLEQLARLDAARTPSVTRFQERYELADELHRWAHRWGRRRSLADAFVLPHELWRALHIALSRESEGAP